MAQNIPLFITHGVNDSLVPFTQAEAMMAAMEREFGVSTCDTDDLSCVLKLGRYENCGHGWIGGNCPKNKIIADIANWLALH